MASAATALSAGWAFQPHTLRGCQRFVPNTSTTATTSRGRQSRECLPRVSCEGAKGPPDDQPQSQSSQTSFPKLSQQQLQVAAACVTRRSLASYIAASALLALTSRDKNAAANARETLTALELVPYKDEKGGFTLLRPATWTKVDKAGATVLFEDPGKKSSTIGVVVNPVRIPSLREFGSLDDVAEKLMAAERKKESTKEATLLKTSSREANGGVPLYTLEYALKGSRGDKRTLTAVTISSNRLYILNIAYADSTAEPAPSYVEDSLHQVLDSFDLVA